MISNFSEVEKSLKRCLKEKVSITAATVVGFLIAGTVAFGAVTTKDVEFTTVNDGGVKVKVKVDGNTTDVGEATDSISVEQYEALVKESLKDLLTVTTEGGVTTFAGIGDLGKVTATATTNGKLTLIKTDAAHTSITSSLKIEATGFGTDKTATAMEALEGHTVTNGKDGDITVGKNAVGMKANAGATAVNADGATITVDAGAGDVDTAIGMLATTDSAKDVTTLTNDGTITVAKGIGISVDGTGTATVDGTGTIEVTDTTGNVGINIAGTGTTTVNGTEITLAGEGTGINAKGNVELEDIAITLNGAGTGIVYTGETDTTVTTANISTKGMTVGEGAAGITATMSKAINSTLDITTGSIETKHASAIGIKITGTENSSVPSSTEKPSTAIVTTTLGETKGTGVDVTGAAHNDIIVNLKGDTEGVISKTGVNVTDNKENGLITVNVDQNNLSVGASGSLVNIAANTVGTTNVNIYQNVELAEGGNIVTAADDLGVGGVLNVNLNVAGEKGLNVAAGTTALNLAEIDLNGTAYVKNSGTVTIKGTGILLAGNGDKAISLTNQGLITLETVTDKVADNSKISTGTSVEVANYGTITLKDMDSTTFLTAAGVEKLENLTLAEVKDVLKTLEVVAGDNFESVGFIKFSDGEVFTAAEMLKDSDTVANLIVTSNQSDYKAFGVAKSGDFTLTSNHENEKLSNVQFNLIGKMTIGAGKKVVIDNTNSKRIINIAKDGQLVVKDKAELDYTGKILADNTRSKAAVEVAGTGILNLSNGKLSMEGEGANKKGLSLTGAGVVNLNGYIIDADINGTESSGLQGTITSTGSSTINGAVTDIKDIKVTENGMLKFGADSKIVSNATSGTTKTTIDLATGNMGVQIGENGKNVLKETDSKYLTISGLKADTPNNAASGKVVLLTDALTENTEFNLGNHEDLVDGAVVANSDIYYNVVQNREDKTKWNAEFNKNGLIEATGTKYLELNNMYIATQAIHDLLEKDPSLRIAQLDDLYSNNIYSETVKMSLDTLKMNEDAVLSLNVRPKQGEFTAQGKFLFNNTDYDREGVTRDYKVETKNTGLLGALEYGLTDTSSVGFAFSGTKQDLDMKNGASADGDAFYFGLYRNDTFNNIDLTTGLGYMIDRVDAENFIGKDKFDSTALSGYIQGKYNYAIGENLTLSPKARLTVTRFQQDSINTGRMKQEEIKDTMADLELGVEVKKGIALETGKMNLLAGASYTTNVAGKDDDFYRVDFLSKTGKANSTRAKGANLEKNSLKLNIGADVELTNGVFYNGGLSYEFDDEDRDSIGVTLGAGYKF